MGPRVSRANELISHSTVVIGDVENRSSSEICIDNWLESLRRIHESEEADVDELDHVVNEAEEIMEFLAASELCTKAALEIYEEVWRRIESEEIDPDQLQKAINTTGREELEIYSKVKLSRRRKNIFEEAEALKNKVEDVLGPLEEEVSKRAEGREKRYLLNRIETITSRVGEEVDNQDERKRLLGKMERYAEKREEQIREKNRDAMKWMQD